jgi:hypothetical protein
MMRSGGNLQYYLLGHCSILNGTGTMAIIESSMDTYEADDI